MSSLFSDDYIHFEKNHAAFPVEAQSVFTRVADLRQALTAFRDTTENQCVVDDGVVVADVIAVMDSTEAEKTGVVDTGVVEQTIEPVAAESIVEASVVGPDEQTVAVVGPDEQQTAALRIDGPEQMEEARLSPVHAEYIVESFRRED
jgi:hypothetical protein